MRDIIPENITTLVLDLDGTLLDTLVDLAAAVNVALTRYNMPERTVKEVRTFVGNGARKLIEKAVLPGTDSKTKEEVLNVFRDNYSKHCMDKTKAYDGVMDFLAEAKKRGYKLAIVSNKPDSEVKSLNERFFGEFVSVARGESDEVNRKPSPDMVNLALEELSSTKKESVYIGDSEVDIATARNSELPCISVLWGFRDKELLEEQGAKYFANTPMDIFLSL